jgi:thiol-disulfide isomerase/thioredoxin
VPELGTACRVAGIRTRTIISMLTCLIAVAAAVSGCTSGTADDRSPAGTGGASNAAGFIAGDGTVQVIDVADRKAAPALSGKTLTGSTFTLADHLGSVVVLNVWGSWCPPCREEAPELQTAYTRLSSKAGGNVVFVGINTRDNDPGPAIAFERNAKITYPSVYDPSGTQLLGFADSLPPTAIPSTLVIDAKGMVAARLLGATTTTTLVDVVKDVEGS